jgi:hypothetical protein
MKNWILCLALAVSGCDNNGGGGNNTPDAGGGGGGNTSPYAGTWKGDVSGWSVSLVVKEVTEAGGTSYITGTATSNKASCLGTGTLSGTISANSNATLVATSSGGGDTTLTIEGPVSGGKITGFFEAQGETADCTVTRTAATFTRQ